MQSSIQKVKQLVFTITLKVVHKIPSVWYVALATNVQQLCNLHVCTQSTRPWNVARDNTATKI